MAENGNEGKTKAKATEYTAVRMEDGTTEEFAGKRKLNKSFKILEDGTVECRYAFRDGRVITSKLNQDIILQYAGHGALQKHGDETAGLEDVGDMYMAVADSVKRVDVEGQWSMKREGSGFAGTSLLIRALAELRSKTVEEVREKVKDWTETQKKAVKANPDVKAIIDRMEAEKLARGEKVDTAAILATI